MNGEEFLNFALVGDVFFKPAKSSMPFGFCPVTIFDDIGADDFDEVICYVWVAKDQAAFPFGERRGVTEGDDFSDFHGLSNLSEWLVSLTNMGMNSRVFFRLLKDVRSE